MSDVFYLRPIEPRARVEDVLGMVEHAGSCFDLHGVDWRHSFLAADGGRMLCWYRAPDAESARIALRELGSNMHAVWAGTVFGEHGGARSIEIVSGIAEVALASPAADADVERWIAALEHSGAGVVRGFLSLRRTLWVAALHASSEHDARAALADAGATDAAVWPCTPITPRRAGQVEPV